MGKYIRLVVIVVLLAIVVSFYLWLTRTNDVSVVHVVSPAEVVEEVKSVTAEASQESGLVVNVSSITGEVCEKHAERALAIMYSGDVETRPYYSGISDASFVVEMDHRYTHGGTRVMGIFDCEKPEFVGPMRSGRVDFLNVAAAFDAIYVPWGGDSISKGLLKKNVHDHIDCNGEVYPGGNSASCFRRNISTIPLNKEDRAFSNASSLFLQAKSLGYRQTSQFEGFEHQPESSQAVRPNGGVLSLDLQSGFRVAYHYNYLENRYERYFEGVPEFDFDSQERVAPKNIIVISSQKSTFSDQDFIGQGLFNPWDGVEVQHRRNDSGQYPNFALGDAWFDTVFEGQATYYIDGQEIRGSWKKERRADAPFEFIHSSGRPMKFVPGQIWLHVVDTERSVTWQSV